MRPLRDRLEESLAGRYEHVREIGAGGMAVVYLARDVKHGRDVAIKVLRDDVARTIGADRFLGEIHLAAMLTHPHILPLYDSGEADDIVYFAMPNVEGRSLRDRLDTIGQLPIEDAVRIATEVAGALDYAHRHGVMHRDIKPENIMLHDGHALVADFGIGKAVSAVEGEAFCPHIPRPASRTPWSIAGGERTRCAGARQPAASSRHRISRSGRTNRRCTPTASIRRRSRPAIARSASPARALRAIPEYRKILTALRMPRAEADDT